MNSNTTLYNRPWRKNLFGSLVYMTICSIFPILALWYPNAQYIVGVILTFNLLIVFVSIYTIGNYIIKLRCSPQDTRKKLARYYVDYRNSRDGKINSVVSKFVSSVPVLLCGFAGWPIYCAIVLSGILLVHYTVYNLHTICKTYI